MNNLYKNKKSLTKYIFYNIPQMRLKMRNGIVIKQAMLFLNYLSKV